MKHTVRSCVALVLAVCLWIGAMPAVTFAAEPIKYDANGDGTVTFVSLGDSMTTGFGMGGYYGQGEYRQPDETGNYTYHDTDSKGNPILDGIPTFRQLEETNSGGYQIEVRGTYSWHLNEYLEHEVGASNVDWRQLGYSSTRPEDMMVLLTKGAYKPVDGADRGWYLNSSHYKAVTDGIKAADIISFYMGDYSLVFSLENLFADFSEMKPVDGVTMNDFFDKHPEYEDMRPVFEELRAQVEEMLAGKFGDYNELVLSLADTLVASTASYMYSYRSSLELMREMNPTAQFIILGMSNFFEGLALAVGEDRLVNVSDIFALLVDFVNLHRATAADNMNAIFVRQEAGTTMMLEELVAGSKDTTMLVRTLGGFTEDFNLSAMIIDDLMESMDAAQIESHLRKELLDAAGKDNGKLSSGWIYSIQKDGVWSDNFLPVDEAAGWDAAARASVMTRLAATMETLYTNLLRVCDLYDYTTEDLTAGLALMQDREKLAEYLLQEYDSVEEMPAGVALVSHALMRCFLASGVLAHPGMVGHEQIAGWLIESLENTYTGRDYVMEYAKDLLDKVLRYGSQALEAIYPDACVLYYEPQGDDQYLALGGVTAAGAEGLSRREATYVELLSEALAATEAFTGFALAADPDLTPAGALDYLRANETAIAAADLITYQLDAGSFVTAALDETAPDWSRYFDAETAAYADEYLDLALTELGLDSNGSTVAMVKPMVKNIVYAMVAYAIDTREGIEYITGINPDAQIVLVGMYNPLRGLQMTLRGEVIDLGDIMGTAMAATDLYYLVCGALYDNVTFVSVSDAATQGFNTNIVMGDTLDANAILNVLMNMDAMYANAEGHEYMFQQIFAAIRFKTAAPEQPGLPGDINCDGKVSFADAAILYAYVQKVLAEDVVSEQGLMNADVSGDGKVSFADAAILYAYVQKVLAELPA